MTSMTSCIVGKKIWAMGPGPLELFPFVDLAILMAMVGGISEHMLTSWSSFLCFYHFHSFSPFSSVPVFHLLYYLFYLSSPLFLETTQNDPQGLTCG